MIVPLKQGLKHSDIAISATVVGLVEMIVPLKQGLKPFAMTSRQVNAAMLK